MNSKLDVIVCRTVDVIVIGTVNSLLLNQDRLQVVSSRLISRQECLDEEKNEEKEV